MKNFFGSLSEKDKRRYAAIEAMRIGHGRHILMFDIGRFTKFSYVIVVTDYSYDEYLCGAYKPRRVFQFF